MEKYKKTLGKYVVSFKNVNDYNEKGINGRFRFDPQQHPKWKKNPKVYSKNI